MTNIVHTDARILWQKSFRIWFNNKDNGKLPNTCRIIRGEKMYGGGARSFSRIVRITRIATFLNLKLLLYSFLKIREKTACLEANWKKLRLRRFRKIQQFRLLKRSKFRRNISTRVQYCKMSGGLYNLSFLRSSIR